MSLLWRCHRHLPRWPWTRARCTAPKCASRGAWTTLLPSGPFWRPARSSAGVLRPLLSLLPHTTCIVATLSAGAGLVCRGCCFAPTLAMESYSMLLRLSLPCLHQCSCPASLIAWQAKLLLKKFSAFLTSTRPDRCQAAPSSSLPD